MNNRLKLLRKKLDLTQTEFAKTLGISQNFLSAIEHGESKISTELCLSLSKINVNLNWLIAGEGQMFRTASQNDTLINEIISILKTLPQDRQEFVLKVAQDQKNLSDLLEKCRLDCQKM
ncbi:helix-turn-helix transcriptional regulator [bacterium]|nr:helix-turn-helix transcriptional regulator [bacterium]